MKKKRYSLYHVTTIVKRECGIKEQETFAFIINIELGENADKKIFAEMNKQIEMYNEFCPDDMKIAGYFELEKMEIERVGEIWL